MKFIYFIFFALLYLLIRLLEVYDLIPFDWISFYLTDLCAMPLVLGVLLFVLLKLKKDKCRLPIWFIIGMTVYWSFYFEYYLPNQNERYTADSLDVVMYFVGSLTFILWQFRFQKPKKP